MKRALPVLLAAALLGACATKPKKGDAPQPTPMPAAFAPSPAPAATTPSSGPAPYYMDYNHVATRYLEELLSDPGLAKAYDGYYIRQKAALNQIWRNFKKAGEEVTKWVSLYPGASVGVGAFKSVTKTEGMLRKELSEEERAAVDVQRDILLATAKVAKESGIQAIVDAPAARLLYLDPAWDVTDRVLGALLRAKKAQLAGEGGP